jgi:hypothetical protein
VIREKKATHHANRGETTVIASITALFTTQEDLERADSGLHAAGFAADEVGVLGQEETFQEWAGQEQAESTIETAEAGLLGGTALGGLVGLLAGAGSLLVPGVGPLLAAGAWASVLGATATGAGIGAAFGGLMGALVGREVAEDVNEIYRDGLHRGGSLLVVRHTLPERIAQAQGIMVQANGVGVVIHEA